MKKHAKLSMCLLLAVIMLVGCAKNTDKSSSSQPAAPSTSASQSAVASPKSDEKVTLQFFHRWPNEPFNAYFNSVIEDFEAKNPNIKIEVITALNDQYKQKINVVLANDNPPDIFFTWAGEYGDKFVREGKALDLTGYFNEDKAWSDQLIPSAVHSFTKDGKSFAVPLVLSAKFFYYNKAVFDKLGLKPPATWAELIQILEKLKAESGIIPLGVGNKAPWVGGAYITTLNARHVPADVLAKDYSGETGEYTHPGYIEALKDFQELMPFINEQPNAVAFEEERNMFINQQVALSYEETSGFRFFKDLPFEWGFFQLPPIEGAAGDQEIVTGAPEGFMISAQSKHPDEAMKFLKYLISSDNAAKYVKETNYVSAVKGAINQDTSPHPLMIDAANKIIEAKAFAEWVDTLTDTRVATPYMAGLQDLLNKKKTPEQVMQDVQAAAKQVRDSK